VQRIGHIAYLDHHRHVINILACASHVNRAGNCPYPAAASLRLTIPTARQNCAAK
jgi:hypothetical protein